MRRRTLLGTIAVAAALLPAPVGGAAIASPTVRLAISHVVHGCHVWSSGATTLGAARRITVRRGTRLVLRVDCPMDFDLSQVAGPKLRLGATRMFAGTSRTVVFRKRGLYRLRAVNVQTPEERGLVTLGETNTLTLTVRVR